MLSVKPIIPSQAIVPPVKSSSKHILKRRLVEIRPQAQVDYTYAGNNEIIFNINSPSDFIDFSSSYIRLDLTCDALNNAVSQPLRYLSEGGVHSLIRNLIVETQAGTEIERVPRYNKLYALLASCTQSPDYVEHVLHKAGDSMEVEAMNQVRRSPDWEDVTITTLTFDATGGPSEQLVTGAGTLFLDEFQVGDLVLMADPAGSDNCIIGEVGSITSNTVMNLAWSVGSGDVDLANTASVLKRKSKGQATDPMRKVAANTDDISLNFQPFSGFLSLPEWIPLFLLRGGLRIRLELERPEFVLAVPREPVTAGFSGFSYTIKNPVYVCSMVQPDQSLSQQYLDMYRTQGLAYVFVGYKHFLDIYGSGSAQFNTQMSANVRSARHVLSKIQNLRAETVTDATVNSGQSTFTCDSIAQGLKANLSAVQYVSGSERFPQSRPVDMTDISNSEMFCEVERLMGHSGVSVIGKRFYPEQWQERVQSTRPYESTAKAESQRLIIGAELSTDTSPYCGLDLSLAPLQAEFTFDATYQITDKDGSSNGVNSDRYVHNWLGHDIALHVSEQGVKRYE